MKSSYNFRALLMLVVMALAAPVWADGKGRDKPPEAQPGSVVNNKGGDGGTGIGVGVGISTSAAASVSGASAHNAGNTVTITESQRAVSSAVAAGLAASNGTCMGSSSVGAQGLTAGLSFGTTWTDAGCDARYDAQALQAIGQPTAALARLCQKGEIAQALAAAGTPCPGTAKSAAAPAAIAVVAEHTDPIIRRRLGLPPL